MQGPTFRKCFGDLCAQSGKMDPTSSFVDWSSRWYPAGDAHERELGKMASPRQIEANKKNSGKSTGPKSKQGKMAV